LISESWPVEQCSPITKPSWISFSISPLSSTPGGCGAGIGWTGWHCPAPLPELAKSAAQVEGWVSRTVEAATTPSSWFSVTTLLPWSVPPP